METAVLFEGSGEELLAQAEKWKDRPSLKLVEVPEKEKQVPETDYIALLPPDTVWKKGVPQFPVRPGAIPITPELIKEWLEED